MRKVLFRGGIGFTLIELLIAVAIIGVLAGSVFFALNPVAQFQKANDGRRKSDLKQIQNAIETYYNDTGKYPVAQDNRIEGLEWGTPWVGYMSILPKDPNPSRKYVYVRPDEQTYYIYASLERETADLNPQSPIDCGTAGTACSYGVSSPNTSISMQVLIPTSNPTAAPTPTATPTTQPAQTPVKTNYSTADFISVNSPTAYTMGYRFKPNVNGKITALWDYSRGGTKTLKLWSDTGTLLNSVTVGGINANWVQGVFTTSTNVTAGTYYRVTTYTGGTPGWYYKSAFVTPVTHGDIVITSKYFLSGDNFPTTIVTANILYGIPDISFVPD